MATGDTGRNALESWYTNNVARPTTADEAYGYWAFVVGAALGVVGLALFLFSTTLARGGSFWTYRALSFSLVALGLPAMLYGFVVALPLGERATRVGLLGLAVSYVAVVGFLLVYPGSWNVRSGADYSGHIVGLYALGLAIQVAATIFYPSPTAGTSPDPVEESPEPDAPASKATFELYRDAGEEWRWRLVHDNGNVIADGGEGYSSRRKAQQGLTSVKRNAPGAVVEVETTDEADGPATGDSADGDADEASDDADDPSSAADEPADDGSESAATFEVYEDNAGEWRWRLVHDNGNIIADGGQGFATRESAGESMDRIQRLAPDADTLDITPAAFEIFEDDAGEWRWRLVHRNGNLLADSGEGYASRSGARDGIESVRANVDDGAEVYEDSAGEWRWRLVHDNGNLLADSGEGYASKAGAREGFERVTEYAPEADTLEFDPAGFEVYEDNAGEYRWRLVHRNGQVLADGGEGYASRQKARQGLDSVRRNAAGASVVEVGDD